MCIVHLELDKKALESYQILQMQLVFKICPKLLFLWSGFLSVIDRNVFDMTEKIVIPVRLS